MPHADAARFPPTASKAATYAQVLAHARLLSAATRNWVANCANCAALLWHAYHALPAPLAAVNWAGFYVADPAGTAAGGGADPAVTPAGGAGTDPAPATLTLGPFQGRVACQTIAVGRGVCGAAAATGRAQRVPDVARFPGHIACDADSRSELVVPVVWEGRVVAIIDVDCGELDGFDAADQEALEALAEVLAGACDWPARGRRTGDEE